MLYFKRKKIGQSEWTWKKWNDRVLIFGHSLKNSFWFRWKWSFWSTRKNTVLCEELKRTNFVKRIPHDFICYAHWKNQWFFFSRTIEEINVIHTHVHVDQFAICWERWIFWSMLLLAIACCSDTAVAAAATLIIAIFDGFGSHNFLFFFWRKRWK